MNLPRIAITLGEITGIGPEVALQAALHPSVRSICHPVLLGPLDGLAVVAREFSYHSSVSIDWEKVVQDHRKDWMEVGQLDVSSLQPGRWTNQTGRASFDAVVAGIDGTLRGEFAALVTGPIQKEAWHAAGISYPGHTELVAKQTSDNDVRMMLTAPELSCVLATIHEPLADVPRLLTVAGIVRTIHLAIDAVHHRATGKVRVTVCGLNPHAGENGLFSHGEEQEIIEPAIEQARREDALIIGPVPPDTAFTPRMRSATDVYVCMYHDQGLIPLKAIAFDDGVNVTLGSRIVRTSVDHGTALDIAWRGQASTSSMRSAIELAVSLSNGRGRNP
jgi:4-hydroxythreonine-4-phosphate dehydrogenase